MKYMIKIMPVLFLALMLAGPVSVAAAQKENGIETDLEDGEYSIQVDLEGGSGKASVSSPTLMLVNNARMYFISFLSIVPFFLYHYSTMHVFCKEPFRLLKCSLLSSIIERNLCTNERNEQR